MGGAGLVCARLHLLHRSTIGELELGGAGNPPGQKKKEVFLTPFLTSPEVRYHFEFGYVR